MNDREALNYAIQDLLVANNGLMKYHTAVPYGVADEIITLIEQSLGDGWISVDERLPDDRCIAYTPNNDMTIKYRFIPAGMFKQIASDATHWRPLPQPPKESE